LLNYNYYTMEINSETNVLKDEVNDVFQKNTPDEHFQFSFATQYAPVDRPERNDYYFPKIYDIKKHNFEIAIKPIETPYWRFGFRYSKTDQFPTNTEARHSDSSIVDIHICVGDMRKSKKWHHANKVYLQSYHVLHKPNPRLIDDKYKGEVIILNARWNQKTSKVYYEVKSNGSILYQNDFDLNGFNSCMFGAWSDFNNFILSTDIKVTTDIGDK